MAKCDTCKHKATEDGWMVCDCCIHESSMGDRYEPWTNAERIRAMTDEELCRFLQKWVNDELWARDWGERLWWLQQPCEGSPTVEKG